MTIQELQHSTNDTNTVPCTQRSYWNLFETTSRLSSKQQCDFCTYLNGYKKNNNWKQFVLGQQHTTFWRKFHFFRANCCCSVSKLLTMMSRTL